MSTDTERPADSREFPARRALAVETNGINVVDESERKGQRVGPLLAVVRVQRLRAGRLLRRVRAQLRHRADPGPDRHGRRRGRQLLPGRPGLHRRQARLGTDAGALAGGVRPVSATACPAWCRTSCSSAGRRCSSRCRPWPRRPSSNASAGRRATPPRWWRSSWWPGDRGSGGARLRRDHEDPEVADDRADRGHGRLRRAHRRPHRPRCRPGHPGRSLQRGGRRDRAGADRLRHRLGELGRRLLPLPAAHRADRPVSSSGRPSAAACPS